MAGLRRVVSLYFHWPYCEELCTYCNFNKYKQPTASRNEDLKIAMTKELNYYVDRYKLQEASVRSLYFGGGTPSLAGPSIIGHLLDSVAKVLTIQSDTEINMEANPTSMETEQLRQFRAAGINRLSLGIQSFDDASLRMMARNHSAVQGMRAIATARHMFDNVSFDLIYARPGQSLIQWQDELRMGLEVAGNHLSLYQLSIERGTPLFHALRKNQLPSLASEDEVADMYEATVELTRQAGFQQYEISSYARHPSAISKHNYAYWQGLDYIGIGPGAHGRLTDPISGQRVRTFADFHPDKYIELCTKEGEGLRHLEQMTTAQVLEELVVFGLRTRMGLPRRRFEAMAQGMRLHDVLDAQSLHTLIDGGFLVNDKATHDDIALYSPPDLLDDYLQGGIRPTDAGLARMDTLLPMLLK